MVIPKEIPTFLVIPMVIPMEIPMEIPNFLVIPFGAMDGKIPNGIPMGRPHVALGQTPNYRSKWGLTMGD